MDETSIKSDISQFPGVNMQWVNAFLETVEQTGNGRPLNVSIKAMVCSLNLN